MPVDKRHLDPNAVDPAKWSLAQRQNRYCFESFMHEPLCSVKGALAAPAGTALTENVVNTGRYTFEYVFLGEATAGLYPILGTDGGYDWQLDATEAEGVEVNFGGLKTGHPRNYVASSEDFFARILLHVEDASGADIFFGFRKAAAYAATLTEYSDVIGIRILGDSSSTTGAFTVITNLNNSGSTDYTSTTTSVTGLEDATAVELEVRAVGGKGFVFVNGVEVAGAPAYTFDTGDVLSPTWRFLNTTDVAGITKTLAFECGLIDQRLDATLLSMAGATA